MDTVLILDHNAEDLTVIGELLHAAEATRDIPVIFTFAMDATENPAHGRVPGTVDDLTQPLRPATVLARRMASAAPRCPPAHE